MKIWELEDIQKLPEFGGDVGWFYGLVKHHETGRIGIYEILPGLGYSTAIDKYYLCRPRLWWWTIRDIWKS